MIPKISKTKELEQSFLSKPPKFRIEAVIHDGEYYTIEKWAKVALVSVEEISVFIKETDYLIHKNSSYRTDLKEIKRWYDLHNLDIHKPIVPNNFTPKIFGNCLESDVLDKIDRRNVGSLILEDTDYEKIFSKIKGYGRCFFDNNRIIVHSYSSLFVKNFVLKNPKNTKYRESVRLRDLTDFEEDFLVDFLDFYIRFAVSKLKPHQTVMDMFFDSTEDKIGVTYEWIIKTLCKFDNTKGIPFSGYLSFMLDKYPYDLSIKVLGKDLTNFRKNVVKLPQDLSIKEKADCLNLSLEEYLVLEQRNIAFETLKRNDIDLNLLEYPDEE